MSVGTHLCALYSGPAECDTGRLAFQREGLQHGDRCLFLVDHLEAAPVLELSMRRSSAGNVLDAGESRYCDVRCATDVCLQAGRFSEDRTTSFLADSAACAAEAGFPVLRVMVEMGWLLRQPRAMHDLVCYEAAVDQLVEQASAVVMCAYDLHRFGAEMLGEVLTTHETVLVDGTVLVNPNYQVGAGHVGATEPGEPQPHQAGAEGRRRRVIARDCWDALTVSEQRIAGHVVTGLTNQEIATLLVLSRHTVDAHLKHIYLKLGIHTRVELTVVALHHPVPR
ncbi:MEDS domain-containing protein [Nocardioides sp. Iso805N]|uniref:MEDS domain-containing protein n=1 Tax=Nocardioides sp. Iso805N TaxID=1283287 RepID=UPI0003736DC0|nr:MEDS domain-containing protein [Nocardioides sp. Iso805N]